MTPISPVKLDVKPENSCNNWKCCFGWTCCKRKEEDSPVSVEIVEKVTRTFERHHHSHSSSPVITDSPIPRLPAPPPLLRYPKIVRSPEINDLSETHKKG